jgi:hypothetical protein
MKKHSGSVCTHASVGSATLLAAAGLLSIEGVASAQSVVYLDQGWDTGNQREISYNLSQGAQVVDYDIYLNLENHDSKGLVRDDNTTVRFGFLPTVGYYDEDLNPDRLAVGFAKDVDANTGAEYMGFTCASCHTGQVSFRGTDIRIDGAGTPGDFVGYLEQLQKSLKAARTDKHKLKKLAKALGIKGKGKDEELVELQDRLAASEERVARFVRFTKTEGNTNKGRIDAFGSIGNTVLVHNMGLESNFRASVAPVSVPFLWQTSELERTQYTGIGTNNFARNVGEIIGVFGNVNLRDPEALLDNNIQGHNLYALEEMIRTLKAPEWPEAILGSIDHAAAARGRDVYNTVDASGYSCASCHTLPDENGVYPLTPAEHNAFGKQFIKTYQTPLAEVGTDTKAASLIFQPFLADTGILAGFFNGAPKYPSILIERFAFGSTTQRLFQDLELTQGEIFEYSGYRIDAPGYVPPPDVPGYRARPLPGVWATAPYLHNGSVRTLAELLRPAAERETSFYVGSTEFDPLEVGLASSTCGKGKGKGKDKDEDSLELYDTSMVGNSAQGHEYGVYFSAQDKSDLLEFLKTL